MQTNKPQPDQRRPQPHLKDSKKKRSFQMSFSSQSANPPWDIGKSQVFSVPQWHFHYIPSAELLLCAVVFEAKADLCVNLSACVSIRCCFFIESERW